MTQVSSVSSQCNISGGKVAFKLENDSNLNMKITVLYENCLCNFQKTLPKESFTVLEIIDPVALFNKVLKEKHALESLLPFLKPATKSSKLINNNGEKTKSSRSPKIGVRATRSESSPAQLKSRKSMSQSSPDFPQKGSVKLLDLQDKYEPSPREGTQSDSSRLDEKKVKAKSPRKDKSENSTSSSASPPDASQSTFTSSDSKSISPRRRREEKKVNLIMKSSAFDLVQGKGYFELNDDQTLVLRTRFNQDGWKCKFKRIFLSTQIEFNQDVLSNNPKIVFERVMKHKVQFFSNNFDPFFKPEIPDHNATEKPNIENINILPICECKIPDHKAIEEFSNIYGKKEIPQIPHEIIEIWNLESSVTKKKFCDSFTIFYVHENDIINFGNEIENCGTQKMQINHHVSPTSYTSAVKGPYWVLITNQRVEESMYKSYEDLVEILKDHSEKFKYMPSNLIEGALHRFWNFIKHTPLDSNFVVRCEEKLKDLHMVISKGNSDWEMEIKQGQSLNFRTGSLVVLRFPVSSTADK